uniref:PH domain-containing protein n=1 Tax=Knipowitschia caucasica TaxID=637954 RepID=A0AAV2L855_KNICA
MEQAWTTSLWSNIHELHAYADLQTEAEMNEAEDGGEPSPKDPCSSRGMVPAKSLEVSEDQAPKLCGYLNKLSGKGPLRGYKPRWFVYDPRKCFMYYFKTPQDALPLGHIDISDACFSYDLEAEEGLFEVRTQGKEFQLKVRLLIHFDSLTMAHFDSL